MEWLPHVTVATVIERQNKFLLVQEQSDHGLVFNQPAGHLEANETLQEAAIRETYEETGWHVELTGLVGVALYTSPHNHVTYHRTTFIAKALSHNPDAELDEGIKQALWMSYSDMISNAEQMRSELVIRSVEHYQNGHHYPLELIFN